MVCCDAQARRTIRDVWIRNRQVNRRQREALFVHLFPHDKRLHFYVLYIRELWRNFVTYIVINSLYIVCNQVNFCYEWTGCEKGFRKPCLFACLLPNKMSSDACCEASPKNSPTWHLANWCPSHLGFHFFMLSYLVIQECRGSVRYLLSCQYAI